MNALPEPGSNPLNGRAERFARLVGIDGLTYLAAWCESAEGYPKPEPTPSARVQASRMAAKTADRRAWLAKRKADAAAPREINTSPQSILLLMDDVSTALMHAAKVASAHGADRLSTALKASLTRHVGRHARVSQRVERPAIDTNDPDGAETFARRILEIS
ncbi:hypothetical protein EU803_16665 [Loktanella sp. IMCC34160]|uniref:hypothetical protein n=1 Tax=Loktanella sp. IMCC34160 TaxID=2510646 RepID=UPI00101DBBC6|nr:hypothetical protein [Loktanella sp. IMCC34160]RYG89783.1 hypothetical protein EU803_16665 [Loktanella sp. IMCC34160]